MAKKWACALFLGVQVDFNDCRVQYSSSSLANSKVTCAIKGVNKLHYFGSHSKGMRRRKTKLDPLNQLFLTLVKLKLDLNVCNIAFPFGISKTTVSRYFITWVCFLY